MATARVISVNIGPVREMLIGGRPGRSGIDKRPIAGPVSVGSLGLTGDDYGDRARHGGTDQAVYAYAREDLDWWTEQLGCELRNGVFGENVTTAGLDITTALIGEIWRMGAVIVQITAPRIPCATFQSWTGEPHWVRRFAAAGRPGCYLRVLTAGSLVAGDEIEVLSRPEQQVTISEAMRAFYGDPDLMRLLLTVQGRGVKWDDIAEQVLGRARA
jgi:MOSC domain-containing protein YiiM